MVKRRKKPFFTPARVIAGAVLLTLMLAFGAWLLLMGRDIAVLNPQGIIAEQQKSLIIFTVILSLVVVVPVFTILGVFAWRYREGNTNATYTPDEGENKWLELLWWGIPIIIIAILSVITWVSTHQLDPYKSIASDKGSVRVQVVALQWKWLFIYPDYGLATVNELRMPVGVPVDFDLTADAPMSAFWIPSLGSQTYAMNGMSSKLSLRADKVGEFHGSNTNINGEGYAGMSFKAIAMPDDVFGEWVQNIVLRSDNDGKHLDFDTYQKLAKQSKDDPVAYYHLHDEKLYTKIMQKYMPEGHGGIHDSNDTKTHKEEGSH